MKKIFAVLLTLPFLWARTFCQTLQEVTDNSNSTTNRVAIGEAEADAGVSRFQVKGGC